MPTNVQKVVQHAGDCSVYGIDCPICDCGALRSAVRKATDADKPEELWETWWAHLDAIDSRTLKDKPQKKENLLDNGVFYYVKLASDTTFNEVTEKMIQQAIKNNEGIILKNETGKKIDIDELFMTADELFKDAKPSTILDDVRRATEREAMHPRLNGGIIGVPGEPQ